MSRRKQEFPATIGGRIEEIRARAELTQKQVADLVGGSDATISAYERGATIPQADWAVGFAQQFGVDIRWLLYGDEFPTAAETALPYAHVGREHEILRAARHIYSQTAEVRLHRVWMQPGQQEPQPDDYQAVPILADPVSAGEARLMLDDVDDYALIHVSAAPHPDRLRCIRIAGHSMAPILPDHSIVAFDITETDVARAIGRIVCARTEAGEVVIKRAWWGEDHRYLHLEPDADDMEYERLAIDLQAVPNPIIGVAVWAWIDLQHKEG